MGRKKMYNDSKVVRLNIDECLLLKDVIYYFIENVIKKRSDSIYKEQRALVNSCEYYCHKILKKLNI